MASNSYTLPGIPSDLLSSNTEGERRFKVYTSVLAEKSQRDGTFRRGYDRVNISSGQKAYWSISIPSDPTISALLSRTISSFDIGGIEYRVYGGVTDINSTGAPVYISGNALVGWDRISTPSDLAANGVELDYTEIPTSGSGSSAPGGLLGGEDLRIQPADTVFVLEAFNRSNQATDFLVYLTWIETLSLDSI